MEPIEYRNAVDEPTRPVIAIVDDDPAICEILHDLLTDEGYQTIILAEATPAIDAIRHMRPDLIILDLWMEHADSGWLILDTLRRDRAMRHVPVIVCSGNAFMLGTMADLRTAPRYAFLLKPFTEADLLAKVEVLLATARKFP